MTEHPSGGPAGAPAESPPSGASGSEPALPSAAGNPPDSRTGHFEAEPPARPSYVFFGIVSSIALVADVASKAWAEIALSRHPSSPTIVLFERHLNLTLAYNKGGAWGMFQGAPEVLRKPFFYLVSLAAIAFIVSMFGRVSSRQHALKWGLPLVFGGALGNLADRVIRGSVVDFVDFRADFIESMNRVIAKLSPTWGVTDHWPTFNVADVAICVGVGLMALDMFTSRRVHASVEHGSSDAHGSDTDHDHGASARLSDRPAPTEPPTV